MERLLQHVKALKKRYLFFWLCIIFLGRIVHSQSYFTVYDSIKKNASVDIVQLTDSITQITNSLKQYEESGKIFHDCSVQLFIKGNIPGAIKYAIKEIEVLEKLPTQDKVYTKAIFNLGIFYRRNFEYDKAIKALERVIEIGNDESLVARSYGRIGKNYYNYGAYYKSLEYYKKSVASLSEQKDYRNLLSQYLDLAYVYLRLGDKESLFEGLEIAKKASGLEKHITFNSRIQITLNKLFGSLYSLLGEDYLDESEYYYLKNIPLLKVSKSKIVRGRNFTDIGHLYNLQRKDSAKYYLEKGIEELEGNLTEITYGYQTYVQYFLWKKEFEKAVSTIDKALKMNSLNISENSISKLELFETTNKTILLLLLKEKVQSYLEIYRKTENQKFLELSIKELVLYDNLINVLNNNLEESTKLFWRKEASQAYLYGAYAAHLLGDSGKAFIFMEKNKALLLSEGVLRNTEFANLPRKISLQETTYQKKIYQLESKLVKDEDNTVLQDSLFMAKQRYNQYIDSLKSVYPKYFARKTNVDQISLAKVQQELGEKDAILSYVWNDFDRDTELIIGLISTKDQAKTFKIQNTQEVREQLKYYRKLISEPFTTEEERVSFQKVAHQLFFNLLPNEELRTMAQNKNLTIIPDGDLQNIPFESLITEANSNQYLILNGNVNYSYSYSFLKHNEKVQRKTDGLFIGYSPSNFEELSLSNLTNTEVEVQAINSELEGIIRLQDSATKEDFLQHSGNSKIIHLATHADVGNNPWIAFSDEKLELHELYTYRNNADLVTLSACNTSLGELAKGEGVLSLARGFFYSGSKSVVSSLWEVNDKSTSEIMTSFYKNLKEGQTKSEAINNAKRTYLSSHSLSEQSPYYWSSFILIGDAGTIDISSNMLLYLLAILGILSLISFVFYRKKTKKQVS